MAGRLTGRPTCPNAQSQEVAANLSDAAAVFPALAGVALVDAVADRAESATPDLLPVVDRASDSTWVATGWSGHGWAIAPVIAELVADWVTSGERPNALAPFGADRFG